MKITHTISLASGKSMDSKLFFKIQEVKLMMVENEFISINIAVVTISDTRELKTISQVIPYKIELHNLVNVT